MGNYENQHQVLVKRAEIHDVLLTIPTGDLRAYATAVNCCWSVETLQEVITFVGLNDRQMLVEVAKLVNERIYELIRQKNISGKNVPLSISLLDREENIFQPDNPLLVALLSIAVQGNGKR